MVIINTHDIGVVGSPSTTTEFTVDLLQEASEDRLVGALVAFNATQGGSPITSVGQIVGIELRNRWHEDATFRNLIKRTGEIPPITSRQDTRIAQLTVGATFKRVINNGNNIYEPELLGMVPSTGTRVSQVNQDLIDSLLAMYQERKEIFYLGNAYANDVQYPMWFKHFGSGERGAGEAYHTGVFGKTGSGKSGLAKMILLGYARHPELGILIIDPQGEFSQEINGTTVGQQKLPVKDALDGLGRERVEVYSIQDIQLDEWDLFQELLVDLKFTGHLGIPAASRDNSRKASEVMREALESKHKLDALTSVDALRTAVEAVIERRNYIYSSPGPSKRLADEAGKYLNDESLLENLNQRYWQGISQLFAKGKRRLYGIVKDLASSTNGSKSVVSIDLSEQGNSRFWSESLQKRLIKKLLDSLVGYSSSELGLQKSANVLVMLDEAGRLAPSGRLDSGSEAELLRITLRNAVRETRKYGIGWFFISQTLGGIDNEILQQLRTLFFGFGLALGDEFRKLREFAGGDKRAMDLYQSFRDPHSAPSPHLREFPFMAVGPISPLSFSGSPLFFSAFTDPAAFMDANSLKANFPSIPENTNQPRQQTIMGV